MAQLMSRGYVLYCRLALFMRIPDTTHRQDWGRFWTKKIKSLNQILKNPFRTCQKMTWVEVPDLEVRRRHQSVKSRDPVGADQDSRNLLSLT